MGEVRVPVAAFQDGELPLVCVKTGGRAEVMMAVAATRTPAWTWWLLPAVLPFQLVHWLTRRQLVGWVPMTALAGGRLQRLRWLGWTGLLVGVLSLPLSMLGGSPCLARLGLGAITVAVAAALVEPVWSVGARLDRSGDRVLLTRVHPAFRAAAELGAARPSVAPGRATGPGQAPSSDAR